ncbi:Dam family site-specific DNA-(adenine-N6)-methyltransferase [Spirabiliibacterium falconis]|uniref:Dam family site-specific DNA-(adenine-N6)-methyltransferase n=1 Tax=Spirabiliibacterium falconis TaxID=572023 RepID=UPI001AACA997|nr:Dam family site-specific DNA-(adenine-N6)-methyltransferase [Spirabiliibacterium falconis]MBE2894930.1 Dam family site-specific DNA-(adenine-N6)-methyltransferase [Spirabiliibacterium falconis]
MKHSTRLGGKHRPFLKWAGGKFRLIPEINKLLPKDKSCLIEPFVGAGSVFLNTQFERYILADLNPDLISLFQIIQRDVAHFIHESRRLFECDDANSAHFYYQQRSAFNQSNDPFERALIFLYLNRFGYNGLCRYNSKQQFNVPFGSYVKPYFPEDEIRFFHHKAQRATFLCVSFEHSFALADESAVIYCDPPYAPLAQLSNFTHYAGTAFGLEQQQALAQLARQSAVEKRSPVLISNHDTPYTRKLYKGAKIKKMMVQRHISQNGMQRDKVGELLALFKAN